MNLPSLHDRDVLALDIETTGLDPRTDRITVIAITDGEQSWIIEDDPANELPLFIPGIFEHCCIIGHNLSFDVQFLLYQYPDIPLHFRSWDTMLADQILTAGMVDEKGKNLSHSLQAVLKRDLGVEISKDLQTSFDGGELTAEQREYIEGDISHLIPLAKSQQQRLATHRLGKVWDLERRCMPVFARMNLGGIRVHPERLKALISDNAVRIGQLEDHLKEVLTEHVQWLRIEKFDAQQEKLDEYLGAVREVERELADEWIAFQHNGWHRDDDPGWEDVAPHPTGSVKGLERYIAHHMKQWRKEHKRPAKPDLDTKLINLDSPGQVLAALQHLGIKVEDTTKETLNGILPDYSAEIQDTVLLPLLEYRKLAKLNQSFGPSLLEKLDEQQQVYPSYRQIGTTTGRPSASDPNTLQIPKHTSNYRGIFVPEEGHVYVIADYSQQELRIVADMSGDQVLIDAFIAGQDMHMLTALGTFTHEAISAANMLLMQAGLPPNRTGAEVLQTVWAAAPQGAQPEAVLRLCRTYWKDQESWSGERERTGIGTDPPQLDNGHPELQTLPEDFVREMREYLVSRCASQGPQPGEQPEIEHRDAVSLLSRQGAWLTQQLPEWGEKRSIAKTVGFGTLYGIGPRGLQVQLAAQGIRLTEAETKAMLEGWKETYKSAASQIRVWGDEAIRHGYTQTLMGRKRFFDPPRNRGEEGSVRRRGANFPIQGSAADMTKLAMLTIDKLGSGIGRIVMNVYDEIVFMTKEPHAERAAQIVEAGMLSAADALLTSTPMNVDVTISRSWDEDERI